MCIRSARLFSLLVLSAPLAAGACVTTTKDTADSAVGGAVGMGGAGSGGITATDIGNPPPSCIAALTDPDPIDASVDGGAGSMRDMTSMALVNDMGLGWNLGNTFDAIGGETAWGNPPVTPELIQAIAGFGFKSVRIPITWMQHFGPAPCYSIDEAWISRVQQVVDWVLAAGMYAIINVHHDGGDAKSGGWIRGASTNYAGVIGEYKALWTQIAHRFRNYSDYLIFESMNEVGFDDLNINGWPSQTAFDLFNRINAEFVALVRGSGGNNGARHLLLAGYWTDIDKTIKGWVQPNDARTILSIHYYTPYQFCINGSPTTWGSAAEIAALQAQLGKLKTAFLSRGVPVIVGEFGAVTRTQATSRVYWIEYVTKISRDLGMAPFFWDNGEELDRVNLTWRTPGILDAFHRAASGQTYTITKGP